MIPMIREGRRSPEDSHKLSEVVLPPEIPENLEGIERAARRFSSFNKFLDILNQVNEQED